MPVFNGEEFIKEALDSIINQKFKDWALLISDNSSEDNTQNICEHYTEYDKRIQYFRQEMNVGAVSNFNFVLNKANLEYFMWAAADDVWDPDFLDATVNILENNLDIGFAFSNIVNIDTFGRVIRTYPDFRKFSMNDHYESITNYVSDPEYFGKANIIYSVYRTDLIKPIADKFFISDNWGSDMSFVLAMLSRTKLFIDERVLFRKRYIRPTDNLEKIDLIEVNIKDYKYIYPLKQFEEYISDHLNATKNTLYYSIVNKIMELRFELVTERVNKELVTKDIRVVIRQLILLIKLVVKRHIKYIFS